MIELNQPAVQSGYYPLALVTGAGHRLGKAFALALARNGYAIALHYHHSGKAAAETESEIRAEGVPVFPLQADLRKVSDIQTMFASIELIINQSNSQKLSLKVLVNSAAIMLHSDAKNMPISEFDETFALNLKAPFLCAQLAYHLMSNNGLIVNISDIAAQKTWTGYPAYTVSKAGLEALTKILARSFAPRVRVNAIAPGLVLPPRDMSSEEWQHLVRRIPGQRAASPEELGSALEFLLKNEYITGQTIVVDGGFSLI